MGDGVPWNVRHRRPRGTLERRPASVVWIGWGDWPLERSNRKIGETAAESQRIVAARPLYRLQYRVSAKSSARDLPNERVELPCTGRRAGHRRVCSWARTSRAYL